MDKQFESILQKIITPLDFTDVKEALSGKCIYFMLLF